MFKVGDIVVAIATIQQMDGGPDSGLVGGWLYEVVDLEPDFYTSGPGIMVKTYPEGQPLLSAGKGRLYRWMPSRFELASVDRIVKPTVEVLY